ncbi:hypothetical protein SAMN05444166_0854 [Singulisphaera sp. GP187]|uniref:hypothetical protein n=1 Tax=Singulisphaera sp. GP187 TaxID=1882752 RepID=UPI000928876C|nr:hypothetical protein [Singulisphaera sp. GP187]SIN78778.1 hypothetical protein SAMN05444166_0854 [Singulisphaera sp. GP187]
MVRTKSKLLQAAGGKFGYLLLALIALKFSAPLIVENRTWTLVLAILTSGLLVAILYASRPGRRSLVLGSTLTGLDILVGRLSSIDEARWLLFLQVAIWLVTLTYVTFSVIEVVLESDQVSLETMQAALCVYLLLGLIWTYLFMFLEISLPGSFQSHQGSTIVWTDNFTRRDGFARLLILSDSTLTSTGFGDLAPSTGLAIMAANLEAFTAQVYLAIVIARIVAAGIAQKPPGQS